MRQVRLLRCKVRLENGEGGGGGSMGVWESLSMRLGGTVNWE